MEVENCLDKGLIDGEACSCSHQSHSVGVIWKTSPAVTVGGENQSRQPRRRGEMRPEMLCDYREGRGLLLCSKTTSYAPFLFIIQGRNEFASN